MRKWFEQLSNVLFNLALYCMIHALIYVITNGNKLRLKKENMDFKLSEGKILKIRTYFLEGFHIVT